MMPPSSNFLNSDHLVSLDAIVKVLNQEMHWCYNNPMPDVVTSEFREGFIKGIEQAKNLAIKVAEIDVGDDITPVHLWMGNTSNGK